jgi:hypothetical protein
MHRKLLNRSALVVAAGSAAALIATACLRDSAIPTQPRFQSARANLPPAAIRVPQARSTAIAERVAELRGRGLTAAERARVASLRGKWQWVADLHHRAMQEAIHDPSLRALEGPNGSAEKCAAELRYMVKYAPLAEARGGHRARSDAERLAGLKALASQVGGCRVPEPASIFARAPVFSTPAPFAGGALRADSVSTAWLDYATTMAGAMRGAKSLADANGLLDAYVAVAAADASLSPTSVAIVAGVADLTASSALEWDTYFQTRESSMFIWGWLSAIGEYIVDRLVDDAEGCVAGAALMIVEMAESDWSGGVEAFGDLVGGACAVAGIAGSVLGMF